MGRKKHGKSQVAAVKPVEPEQPIEEPAAERPVEHNIGDRRLQRQQEQRERDEKQQLERQAKAEQTQKQEGKSKKRSQRVKSKRTSHSNESSQPATPAHGDSAPPVGVQRMSRQEGRAGSCVWADDVEPGEPATVQGGREASSSRGGDTSLHASEERRGNAYSHDGKSFDRAQRGGGRQSDNDSRTYSNQRGGRQSDNDSRTYSNQRGGRQSDNDSRTYSNQRGGRQSDNDSRTFGNQRGGGRQSYSGGYSNQRSGGGGRNQRGGGRQNYSDGAAYNQHTYAAQGQDTAASNAQDFGVSTWCPGDGAQLDYQHPVAMDVVQYSADDAGHNGSHRQQASARKASRWGEQGSSANKHGGSRYQQPDGQHDPAFCEFQSLCNASRPLTYGKVEEVTGDLFDAPSEHSLAHCVAEDMSMGAGIAKTFRSKFGRVPYLLNQGAKTGGLAVLDDHGRYIYYLVTKRHSYGKPTMYTLWQSLAELKQHCQQHGVTVLAIPQIGCGLDRLVWSQVKQMLEFVFRDVDVHVQVYSLDSDVADDRRVKKAFVNHQKMSLVDIIRGTGLLYLGYVDGTVTADMESLADKFNFLPGYRASGKQVGDVVRTAEDRSDVVYGLIVGQTPHDRMDFQKLDRALRQLAKHLKNDDYYYVGVQAFVHRADPVLMDKLVTVMQYALRDVEIWVCWPKDIEHLCPQQPARG